MGIRVNRINQELKFLDPSLYATQSLNGMIQIYRKGIRYESYQLDDFCLLYSRPNPHYILSLTHNWSLGGTPVEWGIEPLMERLKEIDSYREDVLSRLEKEEERTKDLKKRATHNEFKALAADLRKDFAKSTNEINTSSLAKRDSRRLKDAYCR